jgi:hypothetical protein
VLKGPQLAMKALHASLTLSSRQPGSSLQVTARNTAPDAGPGVAGKGGLGAGSATAGGFTAGATGAATGGGSCFFGGAVVHAAASVISRQPHACKSRAWNFAARSFIIAASITSPFAFLMDLLWLLLEAGVALALLLGIVWWTWPRRAREHEAQSNERDPE